jgi:hypothetical protein
MNFDAFVAKWNGSQVTAYSGECVALVAQYCVENGKPIAYANAKDWWGHPALTGAFTFEANRPTDLNQVPLRGDIMIWDGGLAGSGGYGHIAIYDARVSPGVFRSFDQNWGGRQAHFVNHTYANVIGWMRPKTAAPPQSSGGDEMIANADQATKIYQMLRPNSGGAPGEIAGTAGKRSFANFLNDAQAEINQRDASLRNQNAQLTGMQTSINQLNQTITAITQARDAAIADGSKTKAELVAIMAEEQAQLAELAKLTSDLETAHDTIKDLQEEAKPVDEKVVVTGWLKSIWDRLFKKET